MGGGERGKRIEEGREEGRLRHGFGGMDAPVFICSRFRDNGPQTYWGHDLDLPRSHDVIEHVTIRFAMCLQFTIGDLLELNLLSPTVVEIFSPQTRALRQTYT